MADFIAHIDELYNEKKMDEVFEELKKAGEGSSDVEVLWRLTRAYYEQSENAPEDLKKEYLVKALELIKKMQGLGVQHWAIHKWNAIVLAGVGLISSTKEKIANAYIIKEEALKALELKPKDPTVYHLLGRWSFNISNIGWIERAAASALFGTPPVSSFDEALNYFLQANDLEPTVRNTLFIGDTYVALKQRDNAKIWYQKAVDLPFFGAVQEGFHKEAADKLAKL